VSTPMVSLGAAATWIGMPLSRRRSCSRRSDSFEPGRREGGESVEGRFAIGVDAEVFAITGKTPSRSKGMWRERSRGRGHRRGDDFDGVGIMDVGGGAADGKGCDLNLGALEELQQRHEVLRREERLVSLDVDVDVAGMTGRRRRHGRCRWAILGSEDGGQAVGLGEVETSSESVAMRT